MTAANKVTEDIQKLEATAIIELYEIDVTELKDSDGIPGKDILRFHAGTNDISQEIVWQGNIYIPFPIIIDGFNTSGRGTIPTPSIKAANITSILSSYIHSYGDLIGAKVTRKRTLAKYLDNYCLLTGDSLGGVCTVDSSINTFELCTSARGGWDSGTSKCTIKSKTDCIDSHSGSSWDVYNHETCSTAGGIWHSNNNSIWVNWGPEDLKTTIGSGDDSPIPPHGHTITLTQSQIYNLVSGSSSSLTINTGYFTKTGHYFVGNVDSINASGGITGISIVNAGAGYELTNQSLALEDVVPSALQIDQDASDHTHDFTIISDADLNALYEIQVGKRDHLIVETNITKGHSHKVSIYYDASTSSEFSIEYLDGYQDAFNTYLAGAHGTALTIKPGTTYNKAAISITKDSNDGHILTTSLNNISQGTAQPYYNVGGTWIACSSSNTIRLSDDADNSRINESSTLTIGGSNYTVSSSFSSGSNNFKILGSIYTGSAVSFTYTTPGKGYAVGSNIYFSYTPNKHRHKAVIEWDSTNEKLYASSISLGSYYDIPPTFEHNMPLNISSDIEADFPEDIYYIERKVRENKIFVELELASSMDVEGVNLPSRKLVQNSCPWKYKGTECTWSSSSVFVTKNNSYTGATSANDDCGKTVESCRMRFGYNSADLSNPLNVELPFGGFPGAHNY